jgi:N-carbamoyl-L-amino-acid hydrolase
MSSCPLPTARIDGERLWASLMAMAEIGATQRGGCNRQALTNEDWAARNLFVSWARAAGCSVSIDAIGNVFVVRPGEQPQAPPVLIGSHLDTQPTGGRFDGVFGVMAGLEVLRTLADLGVRTQRSIEVASWTNEEGCRFAPAMLGSGVVSGVYELEYAYNRRDRAGLALGEELARIGYKGNAPARRRPLHAAFEAHIEQGPVLESTSTTIGVVTGIQGAYWFDVTLDGLASHAGSTPMELRRDPWRVACPLIEKAFAIAAAAGPGGRATIGDIKVNPGSRNTVPQQLVMSVDLRHPQRSTLEAMVDEFRAELAVLAERHRIGASLQQVWHMPPTQFDAHLVDTVDAVAAELGFTRRRMVSGAGHDSLHTAQFAPTAMIFVPCAGGLSHNEAEAATAQDLAAGADVLLQVVVAAANDGLEARSAE